MERDLIYDVGAHKGEDTDFYLHKGFRVVAVEALDELVKGCHNRFSEHLNEGRLILIHAAVAEEDDRQVPFYENTTKSVWGTLSSDWAKSKKGTDYIERWVVTRRLSSIMKQHGIPYYLKIDIEGMDMVALKSLEDLEQKPSYISIESEQADFSAMRRQLAMLRRLGYRKFNYVNQANVHRQQVPRFSNEGNAGTYQFASGSSGLFGTDLPGMWLPYPLIFIRAFSIYVISRLFGKSGFLNRGIIKRPLKRLNLFPRVGWYDVHGKR